MKDNHEVLIAGSGASLDLLRIEFPSLRFFEFSTETIKHFSEWPKLRLLFQAARFWRMIDTERRETAVIVEREKIDRIISDNRYGCYHASVPAAIITHQLTIQGPQVVNRVNEKLIRRFNESWVPDSPDHLLSGSLSVNKKIEGKFLGPLSRMKSSNTTHPSFQILGLVSGPEPARTDFENLITSQLKNSGLSYKIVQGLPSSPKSSSTSLQHPSSNIFPHLPSSQLNELIEAAEVVICRSGYSTIMDLAALKKKAIFIPTPGQTEQLYLAEEMQRKKIAPTMSQRQFHLQKALDQLKDHSGFTEDYFSNTLLQTTLREFLD
ncbi:MAG TPA: glycosyltransferase [Cyclobacteriaceae bacterium]|nr:glycosyltransferase [Cyclobacteriaceae bacterium]